MQVTITGASHAIGRTLVVLYGVSANTRGWWDLGPARALGYRAQDDAERWAAEIEAAPQSAEDRANAGYVGGGFTRITLGA